MDSKRKKLLLRGLGYVIILLSIAYLANAFWQYRVWILAWRPSVQEFIILSLLIVTYSLASVFLSVAWCMLNKICEPNKMTNQLCIEIYGITQIGKYLPGNIFHFIGRHALGAKFGLSNLSLSYSAAVEIISLFFVASVFTLMGVLVLEVPLLTYIKLPSWAIYLFLIICSIVFLTSPKLLRKLKQFKIFETLPRIDKRLIAIILAHMSFFFICCLLTTVLTYVVSESSDYSTLLLAFFCYPISWLVGYITPGASAGFGVREATIILILSILIPTQVATLIAMLMRIITILGDLFHYMIATILRFKRLRADSMENV